jgi:hypothetical protein
MVGLSKRTALPPVGITAGRVHGRLEPASQRFAQLIARHKQALAMCGACCMEFSLEGIWLVIRKPVLLTPALLLAFKRR